jgi:hypothetical protein
MANHEEPFIFPSQTQQVFFVAKDHNPKWKIVLHKESRSIHCEVDSIIDSNNINDYAQCLNPPLLTPPTNERACLLGAKELSTKDSTIVDEIVLKKAKGGARLISSLDVCKPFW